MSYYSKYVEPVVKNFEFFIKNYPDSAIADFIKRAKRPWFELYSSKSKKAIIQNLYWCLMMYYNSIEDILKRHGIETDYSYKHDIYSDETGRRISVEDNMGEMYELSKKHRGIGVHASNRRRSDWPQYERGDVYSYRVNRVDQNKDEKLLCVAPTKGKTQDFSNMLSFLRDAHNGIESVAGLERCREILINIAGITRPLDPSKFGERKNGTLELEQEIQEELSGRGKIQRAALVKKDMLDKLDIHKQQRQQLLQQVESEIATLQHKMNMSLSQTSTDKTKLEAFKSVQTILKKLIEKQQRLIELKGPDVFGDMQSKHIEEYVTKVKQEIAEHFFGLQK